MHLKQAGRPSFNDGGGPRGAAAVISQRPSTRARILLHYEQQPCLFVWVCAKNKKPVLILSLSLSLCASGKDKKGARTQTKYYEINVRRAQRTPKLCFAA